MLKKLLSRALLLLSLLLSSSLVQAKITLSVDRNEIRENETFQILINVEDMSTLQALDKIDFLPKELVTFSNRQIQKSVMVNGNFTNQLGWNLGVISKTSGTYTIPSFTIGNEKSEPFSLRILPSLNDLKESTNSSKIKINARLSSDNIYVQQQFIYSVRVYISVLTKRRNLTQLRVPNAVVEKISDSIEFQTIHEGTTYKVIENQYVIFPQKSGELIIEPITYSTNIVDSNSSYGSLNRYKPISLESQRFTIQVKPKPDNAEDPWLPAKKLSLTASWQPQQQSFSVGKPANLNFFITGNGLMPDQLPQVEFPEIEGLKIYRDKPVLQTRITVDGITSYHFEKLAVIPSKEGSIAIPEIKISFWNTKTDSQDYAVLPSANIQVEASTNVEVLPQISQTKPIQNLDANTSNAIEGSFENASSQAQEFEHLSSSEELKLWQWMSFILGLFWLLTLSYIFLKKYSSSKSIKKHSVQKNNINKINLNDIKQACLANNANLATNLLIKWSEDKSSLAKIHNLDELAQLISSKKIKQQIKILQASLYSNTNSNWSGSELAFLLKKLANELSVKPQEPHTNDKLPGLYE